jgi:hypothetical protein
MFRGEHLATIAQWTLSQQSEFRQAIDDQSFRIDKAASLKDELMLNSN